MDFTGAVWTCFESYATFSGRASRMEFWSFAAFLAIGTMICLLADDLLFPLTGWSPIGAAFSLLTALPGSAVMARRLHDIGKSGWLQMGGVLPIVGWVFLILWACRPGDVGANRYGPDPLPVTDDEKQAQTPHEEFAQLEQRVMARFAQSAHWRPEPPTPGEGR
jgi:uncharacterized membrane protein YhaH (DUF805 family)